MELNISKLVQEKLNKISEEKIIEKKIEELLEKTIIKAVEDSLEGYYLKREISEKMREEVSKVVSKIDFQSYNGFMIEKMRQIINETCREDLCDKIEKRFKDLFLCGTKEIKLFDIFKKYGEILCETVDYDEKFRNRYWYCKFKENEEFNWIDCGLSDKAPNEYMGRFDRGITFTVHRDAEDKNKGIIYNVYFDGKNIKDMLKIGCLNDVELLLTQAVLNEIPIIIDIESEDDIDNSYDIDY